MPFLKQFVQVVRHGSLIRLPYLSPLDGLARLQCLNLDSCAGEFFLQLLRTSSQQREGAEVHGNDLFYLQQLGCIRSLFRPHSVVIADGEESKIGMVNIRVQSHLRENSRVASEISSPAVL